MLLNCTYFSSSSFWGLVQLWKSEVIFLFIEIEDIKLKEGTLSRDYNCLSILHDESQK